MRKIIFCLLLFLPLFGCSNIKAALSGNPGFIKEDVAIIDTSPSNNDSYLNIYNSDGKKIREEEIQCTDINGGFLSPVSYKNKVYANSIGGYSNRSNKVVEFDIDEENYQTYEIEYGIFSVEANNDYIFTTNSPPAGSIITKYNKSKKSVEGKLEVEGLVQHINLLNNSLYAFSDSDKRDGSSTIYAINPDTLKIEKSIRFEAGTAIFSSYYLDGFIYFTYKMEPDDKTPSRYLGKLDVKNDAVTKIELDENYPNQIREYNGSLLISHYDLQSNQGNKLSVLDFKTNSMKTLTFDHKLRQIEVKDDKLYSYDGNNMFLYNLKDFKLLKKYEIKSTRENYRTQGFFIMN